MKSEVRRGRKFVEYHDPETQDEFTFTQEISGADVSYQETDGTWNPVDESWETDGQDGFSFRAHRMNHKVRFDSIGAWRWYPRRNVETEYIVINRPQCWLTATKRWGNLLVNGISREGRDITLTSVRKVTRVIHSRWNGIKTDWILLDNTAPTKFRQKIDLVGLTELDGWLYGADGERLAQLTPTTAIDANEVELPCSGVYEGGYLQFEADVTGAVYPVTVDPDFGTGTNDAVFMYSNGTGLTWANARASHEGISLWSTNYRFLGLYDKTDPNWQINRGFFRFDTSSIGAGSIVTQVNFTATTIRLYTSADYDYLLVKYNWSAIDGDLTNSTNNETAWDALLTADLDDNPWCNRLDLAANTPETSGNLSTSWINKTGITYYGLIQEFDRTNSEPAHANYMERLVGPNYSTESYRTKLSVTYTAAATGALRRTNMNAQMQSLTGGFN